MTNTVIRDFNYDSAEDLRTLNMHLSHQLKSSDGYKKMFARGWFLSVRRMSSISQQILSVVHVNYSEEEGLVDRT